MYIITSIFDWRELYFNQQQINSFSSLLRLIT